MKPGNIESMPAAELFSFDDRAPLNPAERAALDDEFAAQQQKIERLNQYYDEVVAELRVLLDQSEDEGGEAA
ncbi:MAG: hypothetical protein E7813_19915 [Bradyrhizobium sp.]|uniref:hypothetical protein n=1 Tax=Bradyrhizobium sp. TaxID=376 RepID=UPI00122081F3|nr:hypothetical protein [Bradyrhizobium sp.]THD62446.1 MAG: hypothetical protein E7813_19915 [Bradyrhizobium sp.]